MAREQYSKGELLQWLQQRCDATGECDQCHKDDKAVWEYPLSPGAFMLCRECFRKAVEQHYGK